MNDRDIANKKDEYLRAYCRKEYLNIYELRRLVKEAEDYVEGKERIYETQVLLDGILGDKGSEAYKVPQSDYDRIKKLEADLKYAEDELKSKKKEGRRTEGYRKIGMVLKPKEGSGRLWHDISLEGFSENTLNLVEDCLMYITGNNFTTKLYVLIYAEGMWGLLENGKAVGVLDKSDKIVKALINAVNRELKLKPEVIVLPSKGNDCFFKDYIACYAKYEDFMRAFKSRFKISINTWLKG